MIELYQYIDQLFGLSLAKIALHHMIARAFFAYIFGTCLLLINKHFGVNTSFDLILKFIVGSVYASAITGEAPYLPALGAIAFMHFLDFAFSKITFHSRYLEKVIKGREELLFANQQFNWHAMRKNYITESDLRSAMRKHAIDDITRVDKIYLEQSGTLAVIPKRHERPEHRVQDSLV